MSEHFLRFPPDSTGKRVAHTVYLDIDFINGTIPFKLGDNISTPSGVTGEVIRVQGTLSVGAVYVLLDHESPTAVVNGEALIVDGVTHAVASGTGTPIYHQAMVLSGGNNPKYTQHIDNVGAAFVRYSEGSPQFDAFGKLQVSQQHTIASYLHRYNTAPYDYTTKLAGSGSLTHLPDVAGVLLSCGTDAGAKVQRTSDEYHIYQPGVSQLLEFTSTLGDTGKPNVIRRAGLYDDENGLFFEMYEQTFNVVLRSKSTGVVVEERYPSTLWNHDRLDGSGDAFNPSGYMSNPTADNIYWIDYQWLGAGSIRFGVIIDGVRIVCHEIANAGNRPASYMSTGSLPFRYEQENIGPTASSSEFRIFCATVKTEGAYNPFRFAFTANNTTAVTTTSATPLMAIRAAQTFNSIDNRCAIFPNNFCVYNNTDQAILFEVNIGVSVTDGTWVAVGGESTAELNSTSTAFTVISGGGTRTAAVVKPGDCVHVPFETFADNRKGLRRRADITMAPHLLFTAKMLSPGTGGNVTVVLNWDEVRA